MSAATLGSSPSQKFCWRPDCDAEPPPGPVAAGGAPEFCCANAESARPVDKSSVMQVQFFMVIFLSSGAPERDRQTMARNGRTWKEPEDIERENAVLVLSSVLE